MALRISQQRDARLAAETSESEGVEALATVRALFAENPPPDPEEATDRADGGDDDSEDDLTAGPAEEAVSDEDFYGDAFGTIS